MIKAKLRKSPKFLTTIETGNNIQLLDEPVSMGGNNQGPTPVQSVYAALAGCICMTLRIYADRHNIPLENVDVEVDAAKKAVSKDDERLTGKEHMIDTGMVRFIHLKIVVSGKLSDDDLRKLEVVSAKCPVHKMLVHGSYITHELALSNTNRGQELV